MGLTCPVCTATTKGDGQPFDSPRSVEAHISASRDEQHRGKQGQDFRDVIGNGADANGQVDAGPHQTGVDDVNQDSSDKDDQSPSQTAEARSDNAGAGHGGTDASQGVMTDDEFNRELEAAREDAVSGMVPAEQVEGLEDELAAAKRRIEEQEESIDALVGDLGDLYAEMEVCPKCDEPLGMRDNITGKRFGCSECGAGPFEVAGEP